VLGAVLLDAKALTVFDSVPPTDFFLREHQTIARRMLAMRTQNKVVDLLTLTDELTVAGEVEASGGIPYIADLGDGLPKATNVEHYGRIVKENSLLRELMRMSQETEHSAQNGTGASALLDQLSAQISALRCRTNGTRTGFRVTALGELLQEREEQVRWVLEDRLPVGGFSLLAGKPKAGKSTLARCLALAVARGERFLNWPTAPGAVLYLALEEKRGEVQRHFREMGAIGDEPILVHAAQAPQAAISALHDLVAKHKPILVIVDPLLRLVRLQDSNDYAEVTQALEPLLALARESGAHVLAVHHLRKGERTDTGDTILGSTAFRAAVDTSLLLKRTDHYRILSSEQRYGPDLPETTLEFDAERRTVALGTSRAEAETDKLSTAILAHLEDRGVQLEPEIMEAVEGRLAHKRAALRSLHQAGRVARAGAGKRKDPFRYAISGFLFPCSQDSVGTREQDTKNDDNPAQNQQHILVAENSQDSDKREPERAFRERAISEGGNG
jgi:AAA domain/DnaB-like helicase N terminal domain